jgi:iron(III) transport system ATP-binding protein
MTSVRLENISKHFGTVVALHETDLDVAAGELFFLLGPSGCGKSTLLRLVAGLHEPTSGRIFFNDDDVTQLSTERRNAVMCFQSYALWPHMTVRENVRFGLEVHRVPRAEQDRRVSEVLALVQMDALAGRKPNELSGGQQQRVALARALVVRPRCLLLDEPLSNLDAKLRLEMRTEIRRICRQAGLTAIYVTHDQKEALSIADRIAILNAGRVEQIGKPQEIYLRPKNRFIANFMGETNFLPGTIVERNNGRVVVETAAGRVASSIDSIAASSGTKVTVAIRPEVIHLGDAPADALNRFEGAVHDTQYLGEVAQHQLNLAPGDVTLKVYELNPRIVARDGAAERTGVWFHPRDVVLLSD